MRTQEQQRGLYPPAHIATLDTTRPGAGAWVITAICGLHLLEMEAAGCRVGPVEARAGGSSDPHLRLGVWLWAQASDTTG